MAFHGGEISTVEMDGVSRGGRVTIRVQTEVGANSGKE